MTSLIVSKSGPLRGAIAVPGDKSITHRALILGALAEGDTRVHGWVPAEVCLATLRCMRALGVEVERRRRRHRSAHPRRGLARAG